MSTSTNDLNVKYAMERAKRLRDDGMAQFVELNNEYGDLSNDLFMDYEALGGNQCLKDGSDVRCLIIGAGHNGLLAAVRLIQAGAFTSNDITLVDKAGGYGGTWYYNRYPGLTCDIEGYIYVPLLEETGYKPKYRYCEGQEIREHAERIARTWDLKAQFGTHVHSLEWTDANADARWVARMTQNLGPSKPARELVVRAQFVYAAPGVYPIGHIPKLPGFNNFRQNKPAFHTSRWNFEITGGSQESPNLTKLRGKRVAVVGTGATAVQVIPQVAKWAKHLYVFQRTPSYCGPRRQQPTDPDEWDKVIAHGVGWQKARQENYNAVTAGEPVDRDLVNDGWSAAKGFSVISGSSTKGIISPDRVPQHILEMQTLDAPIADRLRKHIENEVHDKDTAAKLQPWYYTWCKRPTFHDEYLPTFNKDNVTLVDTDGKGVDKFTTSGIVANGQEYEVDLVILATGYTNAGGTSSPAGRAGMRIVGKNGKDLEEKYRMGWASLHGVASNGFPNLFFYAPTGAAGSSNLTYCLDIGARHSAHIIAEALRRTNGSKRAVIEVTKEAEDAWGIEVAMRAAWFAPFANCTPSYFTSEGDAFKTKPEELAMKARMASWGEGVNSYRDVIEGYRASGGLDGIQVVV